jgi:nucleoside-diphosphate-sugar epimerase
LNYLLTGASGFLGKYIAEEFANTKKLFSLSRTTGDYKVSLENEIPDFKDNFEIVIHSAGKAHSVPKTDLEKQQFLDVNVLGTLNLLKGLEKVDLPKQFVFISSVSVYGLEFGKLINEDAPLLAQDSYGKSKIEAENLVREWCFVNGIVCTILRLPLLVGPNAPGNLGAMVTAIKKGYYFNIGGGKAKKSMVLAKDVAKFISIVASEGGVYNLSDGFHPDFKTLSNAISFSLNKKQVPNLPLFIAKLIAFVGNFIGSKAPINSLKLKKITTDLTFDDSKARQFFNWQPESVIEYIEKNSI